MCALGAAGRPQQRAEVVGGKFAEGVERAGELRRKAVAQHGGKPGLHVGRVEAQPCEGAGRGGGREEGACSRQRRSRFPSLPLMRGTGGSCVQC